LSIRASPSILLPEKELDAARALPPAPGTHPLMSSRIRLQATGETVTFLDEAPGSSGDRLLMEVLLPPGGVVPPPRIRPLQAESLEVLEGTLRVQVGGDRFEVDAGDRLRVEAKRLHRWWNPGKRTVRFKLEVTPALNREWMVRETFASCNRRNSAKPSLWDAADIIAQVPGECSLGNVPESVQRLAVPVLAAVGRLLGLTRVSPKTAGEGHLLGQKSPTTSPPLGR
jgi:quercetin dioxygenase-like cupin family protein